MDDDMDHDLDEDDDDMRELDDGDDMMDDENMTDNDDETMSVTKIRLEDDDEGYEDEGQGKKVAASILYKCTLSL